MNTELNNIRKTWAWALACVLCFGVAVGCIAVGRPYAFLAVMVAWLACIVQVWRLMWKEFEEQYINYSKNSGSKKD